MLSFKDKTVLVTGGSRGIGAATVSLFAELQANVAFSYRQDHRSASKIYERIKAHRARYYYGSCDISDYGQVSDLVDAIITELGKIDILVNNAGIWEYGAVDTMTIHDWQRTLDVNLNSVFYFSKKVVDHMKKKRIEGRLIHIASTAGQRGEAYHSHYAASKGAIISFTKSLATELGPDGITVNCVAPGWVQTDMAAQAIREDGEKILKDIPLGRIPESNDIAGPIVFLASDWARAITGEILNVNAGSVLCG